MIKICKCPNCGNEVETTFRFRLGHPHLFGKYIQFKCKKCHKRLYHLILK